MYSPRNIFCSSKQNTNLASFIFDVACPKVCHSLREEVLDDEAHTWIKTQNSVRTKK